MWTPLWNSKLLRGGKWRGSWIMGVSSSCGVLRASSSLSWCQDARWPGSGQPEVTPTTSSTSTVSTTHKRGENRRHRHSRAKAMCCSISFFFQDFFRNRSLNQGITSTFKPYSLTNIIYYCIYTESRKMVPKILCAALQRRQRCKEQTSGLSWRRRGWDDLREKQWNIYIAPCKTDSQWEFHVWWHPKLVLCDDLEEWGRERSQGEEFGGWRRDTCMPMADSCWCMAKTITIL